MGSTDYWPSQDYPRRVTISWESQDTQTWGLLTTSHPGTILEESQYLGNPRTGAYLLLDIMGLSQKCRSTTGHPGTILEVSEHRLTLSY